MMNSAGIAQMPKQDISTLAEGTKAGYIGEDIGEVETYEPKPPGSTNVAPDLPSAQARVKAAEIELKKAQASLDLATKADAEAKKKPKAEAKPVAGASDAEAKKKPKAEAKPVAGASTTTVGVEGAGSTEKPAPEWQTGDAKQPEK